MWCPDCEENGKGGCFWPLTLGDDGKPEFWIMGQLQRCKACHYERKRVDSRERRRKNPELREELRIKAKDYYYANKEVVSVKHAIYMRQYRARLKKEDAA